MADPLELITRALAGRYAVERQLGEGGWATVYLALDERHRRMVAVKVLKPELTRRPAQPSPHSAAARQRLDRAWPRLAGGRVLRDALRPG